MTEQDIIYNSLVKEINAGIDLFVDATFDLFMQQVVDSKNNGTFDKTFIKNFIQQYIGKDPSLDSMVDYERVLKYSYVVGAGYFTKITLSDDIPKLNLNTCKSFLNIAKTRNE